MPPRMAGPIHAADTNIQGCAPGERRTRGTLSRELNCAQQHIGVRPLESSVVKGSDPFAVRDNRSRHGTDAGQDAGTAVGQRSFERRRSHLGSRQPADRGPSHRPAAFARVARARAHKTVVGRESRSHYTGDSSMEVTNHTQGAFCFAELLTSDAELAKRFYGALFGWTSIDVPGSGGTYSLFQLRDKTVAKRAFRTSSIPIRSSRSGRNQSQVRSRLSATGDRFRLADKCCSPSMTATHAWRRRAHSAA